MRVFRNILHLSVGDFIGKALYFLAFIYLARMLGVTSYGVLEFALAILTYFLLFADGGLELWATREAARGGNVRELVSRILPLRLGFALGSFCVLVALLLLLPRYPGFRPLMILFGLTLFTQALNLKWVFMGQEKMSRVAAGLVLAQILFVAGLLLLVRSPEAIIWVPIVRLVGDVAMVIYFAWLFVREHGHLPLPMTLRGSREVLRPALTLGASHGLGLMSYNLDSILLWIFLGAAAVGLYGAAYKPVTVLLAMPITYFLGLFPALSRAHAQGQDAFREIVVRSLRMTAIFAIPLGVGGIFLAKPTINLLFGPAYANSVPALQILSWSAVLVILRGTYRQALNAAHRSGLDLRCAGTSVALNIILNLLLIPRYGIIGAAIATVVAEAVWLTMAAYHSHRHLTKINLTPLVVPPVVAATVMAISFLLSQSLFWVAQAVIGSLTYFCVLLLLGETEVRSWVRARRAHPSVSEVGGVSQ